MYLVGCDAKNIYDIFDIMFSVHPIWFQYPILKKFSSKMLAFIVYTAKY